MFCSRSQHQCCNSFFFLFLCQKCRRTVPNSCCRFTSPNKRKTNTISTDIRAKPEASGVSPDSGMRPATETRGAAADTALVPDAKLLDSIFKHRIPKNYEVAFVEVLQRRCTDHLLESLVSQSTDVVTRKMANNA